MATIHQFRTNSVVSRQIGNTSLTKRTKAYARLEAAKKSLVINSEKAAMELGLGYSFIWEETPQGRKFWQGIYDENFNNCLKVHYFNN